MNWNKYSNEITIAEYLETIFWCARSLIWFPDSQHDFFLAGSVGYGAAQPIIKPFYKLLTIVNIVTKEPSSTFHQKKESYSMS